MSVDDRANPNGDPTNGAEEQQTTAPSRGDSEKNKSTEPAAGEKQKANQNRYWIGFDLGGTKMLCNVYDQAFNKVGSKRRKSRPSGSDDVPFDRVIETISKTLDEFEISNEQLAGIGIGCPGPVVWEKGVVPLAVNLGWKETPVRSLLEKEFRCSVSVLNDVDAGVYGETQFGAGEGARCVVGLFPGTGIGGGCVYDGTILRGAKLTCMEIGHIRINSSPIASGAPMSGTVESLASRLAVAAECAKLAFRGQAPTIAAEAGSDLSKIKSKLIAESIKNGDREVERVVNVAIRELGYTIANLVHLLSPDVFVLGGGLVEAMPKLIVDGVFEHANENVLDCYKKSFKIRAAKLGDDAVAAGAASWCATETRKA